MVPTAQPAESEPQRATPVLSRRKVVAEAPLGGMSSTFPLGLASTIVDLCNSPSMIPDAAGDEYPDCKQMIMHMFFKPNLVDPMTNAPWNRGLLLCMQ